MSQVQPQTPPRKALADDSRLWLILTVLATAVCYLSTLQLVVNGSTHPYATDVGEIQNALPRWGTIHYPGYPLYSLLGSLFVTLLRLVGVAPAAGSSLFSAVWGVVVAALLFGLARELGAGPIWAALGALVAGLGTSLWADSSLAEIHTMGTALFLATLLCALRFGRYGRRRDLLWLSLAFSQGLMHQRTMLFLAPAVLFLVWPRRMELWRGLPGELAVIMLAPLAYLYLPIRAWQGARWTFGAVGTWHGFLQIFLDTKVDRIVAAPAGLAGWLVRLRGLAGLLNSDLWLPILALGLGGLWLLHERRNWREPLALALAWLPAPVLSLVIWEGGVSDALLAAKLPVLILAGVGLGLGAQALAGLGKKGGLVAAAALAALLGAEVVVHRPEILAVTRDQAALRRIAVAEQVAQPQGGRPTTFMALWGHTYWALTYAQAYRGQLAGLTLVDHNADFAAIAGRGDRLLTFTDTFYICPLAWWEERLGRTYLSSPAPGIVELSLAPGEAAAAPAGRGLDLGNGVRILSAGLSSERGDGRVLTVCWQANGPIDGDYSVAVHLLAQDPPQGPADILAQADRNNPVQGWYPTSRWTPGEVVRDTYLIVTPPGSRPVSIRVGMYRALADGSFAGTPWLTIPLPGSAAQ